MLEDLPLVHAAWRPHVGVGVHVARHDRLPRDVEHPGALRGVQVGAHRRDPVVLDEDVATLDEFLAVHRENPRGILQQDPAARAGPRLGHHRVEGVRGQVFLSADRGGVLPVDAVSERPDHRVPGGGPGEVVAAFRRHFAHRHRRLAAAHLDIERLLPEARDLDQVVAVLQLEERAVPARGQHDLAGGRRVLARAAPRRP